MPTGHNNGLYPCRNCGSRFDPNTTGGVCPYCKDANPALISLANKNFRKRRRVKKQLKTAAVRISLALILLIALIVSAVAIVSTIAKNSNSAVFEVEDANVTPFFYNDTEGRLYFSFDRVSYLIGKGSVSSFVYSDQNKVTYAVFDGNRNIDSTASGSYLLRIADKGKKIETVAETHYGTISFVQGGNCEYIYYIVDDVLSSYQTPSYLYCYNTSDKESEKIDEYKSGGYFDNFKVSPNGKYLLYKSEDESGTRLMKYSAKSSSKTILGIKNAEPISIDNKGKCFSYIKKNTENGLASFYVETSVTEREETVLPAGYAKRIVVSSDCRSFVIDAGSVTIIKQFGLDPVTLSAHEGLEIGISRHPALSFTDPSPLVRSGAMKIEQSANKNFFPYCYISETDNGSTLVSCNSNGEKTTITPDGFDYFCTNGKKAAFILNGALYTANVDAQHPAITLASENFGEYSLYGISDNGKYIFCKDENSNLIRIPFKYNGSGWTVMAFDPKSLTASSDGKHITYSSVGVLNHGKNEKSIKIAENTSDENVFALSDGKKAVCLSSDDANVPYYTLYYFNGKKTFTVFDKATKLYCHEYLLLGNAGGLCYESPVKAVSEEPVEEFFDDASEPQNNVQDDTEQDTKSTQKD